MRRVSFRVEPARVGHRTDFDRLTTEVSTNGAVTPAEAISDAAKILDRYLILFFDFQEQEEDLAGVAPQEAEKARLFQMRIEDLDFSVRTFNCLRREGISNVGERFPFAAYCCHFRPSVASMPYKLMFVNTNLKETPVTDTEPDPIRSAPRRISF